MIFEGGIAVLGESRGVRKQLGETLTLRSAFEDAQSASAALGGCVDVHFDGEARATLGELRGELDFGGLAVGLFFQDFLHRRLRKRREMKLQAPRDDGWQQCIRRGRGENERGRAGRFLENLKENVGDVPAHRFRSIEDEDAATAQGLKVGGALDGAQLAHTQHRPRDGAFQANRIRDERPNVWVRLQN